MNKLDMAHDYMVAWMQSGNSEIIDANELASFFFSVADAMKAEADKREPKGFPEAILTKKPNGECAHFHTTLNRTECFDCGEFLKGTESSQLDWQPDWIVAPKNMIYFAVDSNNDGYFYEYKPYISEGYDYWGDAESKYEGLSAKEYNDHTYQGDWKQSLRKRPQ